MENSIQSWRRSSFSRHHRHFIRSRQQIRRDSQADLLGGFQIDDKFILLRLRHR